MRKILAAWTGAVAVAASLLAAVPAQAAYPGTNGPIVSQSDGTVLDAPCLNGLGDTEDPWTTIISSAAFSRSGRYLAYGGSGPIAGDGLFVIDIRGCLPPRRIGTPVNGVAWSPDGTQLAVIRNNNIEIVNSATGALVRRLTNSTASKYGLSWRPGGGRIAYTVEEGGQPTIRTISTNGGPAQFIARGADPDYHPTSNRIAFARNSDRRIVTVNESGGDLRTTPITAGGPLKYSPDGRQIATSSATDPGAVCIRVTTGGSIQQRWGYSGCWVAAWGPRL